ncbi:ABC transporter permease [Desulfitibacter alkalitolerans]|uniref:ABC transporter permease n=1 Tax=Desulfitibacter alkalitolerans TaxID=264641 RepID=UPI001A9A4762|nr:ABC transporter permease [Desulfitibacter alkalitolerans]
MVQYILNNQEAFLTLLGQHLNLTFLSVGLAMIFSIPLAIIGTRVPYLEAPIMAFGNLGQTIPSLVILALAIPLVGIGFAPALLALFLRAVLPILLNTFVGIKEVDPAVIEAARGMGMTDNQILFRVQLPLTVPVIVAGIKTATVQCVSLATLAAFVGGGSLGDWIQQGIMMVNQTLLLAGAVPTAVLAIMANFLIGVIQNIVTPRGLKV